MTADWESPQQLVWGLRAPLAQLPGCLNSVEEGQQLIRASKVPLERVFAQTSEILGRSKDPFAQIEKTVSVHSSCSGQAVYERKCLGSEGQEH